MCGPPGSGKTTLAQRLAEHLHAVSLSVDAWLAELGLDLKHDLREPLGNLQWRLAQELLAQGQTVIMESGHWMRPERDEKRLAARDLGAAVELQYLDVPREELHRRVARRNAERPWAAYVMDPAELDKWLAFFDPPDAAELSLFDPPTVLPPEVTRPSPSAVASTRSVSPARARRT